MIARTRRSESRSWWGPLLAAILLSVAAGTASAVPPPAPPSSPRTAAPARARVYDTQRHIDVNRLNMFTTNFGHFAWDLTTGSAGLIWPRGTSRTAVFASGLWLGCRVNGQVRIAVAEYASEYGPGGMIGGTFDDPERPEHQVYKVARWTGNPSDSTHVDRTPDELAADPLLDPLAHHSWSEYLAGAKPYGAPTRFYRLPDPATPQPDDSVDVEGPDVLGDQMLWEVHNDADPAHHNTGNGSTDPLGVEVQQTTFAFDRADGLGNVLFVKFRILNQGANTLENLYASVWSDPDVGGSTDDLVGCDVGRALGFAYNGTATDLIYGSPPPAVGYVLLRGPTMPGAGTPLGLTAFNKYANGMDPSTFDETYHYMQGLLPDGSVLIDPTTNQPTSYFVSGDPVTGQGWLDISPADRRMLLISGPTRMLPGDVQEVWTAIVVGSGTDRLSSVTAVRCLADLARGVAQSNFVPPPGPIAGCSPIGPPFVNCPKTAAFWALECAAGGTGLLSPQQMGRVVGFVNGRATLFDWPVGSLGQFCATVGPPGSPDLRQQARREFAAFLANYSGNQFDLQIGPDQRIWLDPTTPIDCPPLRARNLEELAAHASLVIGFQGADYLDHNAAHTPPLGGINWGGAGFEGGAGVAADFLGSTIDPEAHPDSFTTVDVRFDHTTTQSAYRYLRLETLSTGGPPPQGRAYLYGGHVPVPFTCWDVENDVQLDVGFVERTVTDDAGVILDPAFQPPTHDSTWGPNDSELGGREYLLVFRRPYSVTPKAELAQDGVPIDGNAPALYALWTRLLSASDVIDDGDAFRFHWGRPPSPGADSLLVELEGMSLADPAVRRAYNRLIHRLSSINAGIGIGETCRTKRNHSPVSLVSAEATTDLVRLRWYAGEAGLGATVERQAKGEDWEAMGRVTPNGDGLVLFEDRDVTPGARYDYRLAVESSSGVEHLGEARVEVPITSVLAFLGVRPNPGEGRLLLAFSLASREPARVALLDVAGRRVLERDVTGLGPGSHTLALEAAARLPAGIYLVRIEQGGRRATGKAAIVR